MEVKTPPTCTCGVHVRTCGFPQIADTAKCVPLSIDLITQSQCIVIVSIVTSLLSTCTDTTVRTEATSEVEMEERQGPAFWNMGLGTSGCVEGEGVHWRRICIIR